MTQDTNAAAEAAIENADARQAVTLDNPNPDYGTPTGVPDAPAGEVANDNAPPQLSKREQIIANARARRAEELADAPLEDLVTNEAGEYIPPFLRRQQEAEAARQAEEAAAAETAPPDRAYTLKVRGNDIPVASRDELVKLAEVEDDEATDFTDAQLIKLAQKQVAASQVLDEAKLAKKTARAAAPSDDDTLSADEQQHPDLDDEPNHDDAPHQNDRRRQLIEKIQFGDPEEATQAFAEAVTEGVKEVVQEQEYSRRFTNVTRIITKAGNDFEAANQDLVTDPDFADILYNKAFVTELKKDLVSQGLKPENVDAVVGNDVRTAMKAYATIAADGRVKTRAPNQMLAAAAQAVRAKFNRPAPSPGTRVSTAPRSVPAPMSHRQDMKRTLTPQPARASVPRQSTDPSLGQAPAARSNVVAQMRKQRGQG